MTSIRFHPCKPNYCLIGNRPAFNGEFIAGRGFNQDFFDTKKFPTKADLDEVSKDIPIIVTRVCGHIAVANSAALKRSNITAATQVEGARSFSKRD
ncbi:MAG: amidohydrolase family protein [Bacillus subtilis]|nr:amidohydrolase family protein [Bacillus subtilis]